MGVDESAESAYPLHELTKSKRLCKVLKSSAHGKLTRKIRLVKKLCVVSGGGGIRDTRHFVLHLLF